MGTVSHTTLEADCARLADMIRKRALADLLHAGESARRNGVDPHKVIELRAEILQFGFWRP
jgi:hypothetical protein